MGEDRLGLVEAVESLRMALLEAIDRGADQRLRFGLAPVEVSLQVEVSRKADGKIGWAVLGAGASYEQATTHTVTLTLTPELELPGGGKTSNVKIGGAGEAGDSFGPQP